MSVHAITEPDRRTAEINWQISKLTRNIGAEIHGCDLGAVAYDDAQFEQLRQLLLQHKVLFFRAQDFSRAEHVALAKRFGPLEDHPMVPSDPENPGLVRIYKDLDSAPERYENAYHSDGSWRDKPAMGAVLHCIECPDVGGDTMWVDMVKAYADLPDPVKQQIAGLHARHSLESTFGATHPAQVRRGLAREYPDAEHPVVRTHPETGEQILYVNSFTTHFVDFHTADRVTNGIDFIEGSAPLLHYLQSRATVPEYQVRWRWTPGSVAIWDNRCTQHYAVQDYWPDVRKMERAGISGEPSTGPASA